ncbi:putative dsRNA-binding protein, partial [Campylobacter concisus]
NGKEISRAVGSSKKQAQQLAAKIALEKIKK